MGVVMFLHNNSLKAISSETIGQISHEFGSADHLVLVSYLLKNHEHTRRGGFPHIRVRINLKFFSETDAQNAEHCGIQNHQGCSWPLVGMTGLPFFNAD